MSHSPILPFPYRLLKELGAGGQGSPWLIYDSVKGRQAVVKIAPELVIDHEAGMLARVRHTGIPQYLETFPLPLGEKGMVMAFIEGLSLEALITHAGPQPASLVLRWAI